MSGRSPIAALIAALEPEVRERLSAIDPAHDWFHVQRVRALARKLLEHEPGEPERVDLLALLHDVCDRKLGARAMSGVELRGRFEALEVDEATIAGVFADLEKFGFPGAGSREQPLSREGELVRERGEAIPVGSTHKRKLDLLTLAQLQGDARWIWMMQFGDLTPVRDGLLRVSAQDEASLADV